MSKLTKLAAASAMALAAAGGAQAATLKVTITNEQPDNGVFLTPLATVFHDGTFDLFDEGDNLTERQNSPSSMADAQAAGAVEGLAEDGMANLIVDVATASGAQAGVVFGPEGVGSMPVGGPPLIDTGETASAQFNVDVGAMDDLFFSFMSMILPTNDSFIGNDNPLAYQIFDNGVFQSTSISVYTSDAWDVGTEENNFLGLPFSTNGGTATDTPDGMIAQLGDLLFINGQDRALGLGPVGPEGLGGATLLATIQISEVPLPAGFPLMLVGLGAFGFAKRRKKT